MHAAGHLLLEIQFTSSLLMWGLQPAGDYINYLLPLSIGSKQNYSSNIHLWILMVLFIHILTMQLYVSLIFI